MHSWYYQSLSAAKSDDGTFMYGGSCHGYPEDVMSVDASWKAARAFLVLTFILSMVVVVCNFLAACWDYSEISQDLKLEAAAYVALGIFQVGNYNTTL